MLMVDKEKIRQKIQFIEDNLNKLEQIKSFTKDEFLNDFIKIEATKHLLQISIEAMIDIAGHVIARNRFSAPQSSADMFDILKEKGILNEKNINNYRLMAKFRNRLVHLYYDINNEEVYSIIHKRLSDFKRFISEIVQFFLNK
jgi:uncharacterized protein YutE (UPF0331/DUF86 family)